MKWLWSYLRERRRTIALLCLCLGVMTLTCDLYHLPMKGVYYGFSLALCIALAFGAWDFYRFVQRRRRLQGLLEHISVSLDNLPAPAGPIEEDYQQLLDRLFQATAQIRADAAQSQREMVAYYTLWAHQIKTPIAAMDLLLQQEESALNRELALELLNIRQYVDMVLSYLRLGSSSTDYVIRRYDLDTILRQGLKKYAPMFIRKGIRLDFRPTGLQVLTDEKWLLFVVEQLLSNALKYTAVGTISIFLAGEAALVIQDTGIGIQPEDLPRVFDLGFTGCNGRIDKKATGIGLYLCRQICDRLGHTLQIASLVGQGTRVTLGLESVRLEVE